MNKNGQGCYKAAEIEGMFETWYCRYFLLEKLCIETNGKAGYRLNYTHLLYSVIYI